MAHGFIQENSFSSAVAYQHRDSHVKNLSIDNDHLDVSILPGVGFLAKNQTLAIKRCCLIWLGLQGFTDKLLNLLHMLKWYLKHTEDDWILNNVLQ